MTVFCPKCYAALRVPEKAPAGRVRCPGCGEVFLRDVWKALAERLADHVLAQVGFSVEVHKQIGIDLARTRMEALILNAWTVTQKLMLNMPEPAVSQLLDAVHESVFVELRKCGTDLTDFEKLIRHRYANYYAAFNDRKAADPITNATKYFMACCHNRTWFLKWRELIPDPNHLALLRDAFTPETLEALKVLAHTEPPTYPLHAGCQILIANHIGEVAEYVNNVAGKLLHGTAW